MPCLATQLSDATEAAIGNKIWGLLSLVTDTELVENFIQSLPVLTSAIFKS